MQKKQPLVTTRDLTEYFGVTTQTVFNWRQEGLPHLKLGNRMRYDLEEVLKWLEVRQEKIEEKNLQNRLERRK